MSRLRAKVKTETPVPVCRANGISMTLALPCAVISANTNNGPFFPRDPGLGFSFS